LGGAAGTEEEDPFPAERFDRLEEARCIGVIAVESLSLADEGVDRAHFSRKRIEHVTGLEGCFFVGDGDVGSR
jgi:hypothetical protein